MDFPSLQHNIEANISCCYCNYYFFGTENGIKVSEDLEILKENDINVFGFNFGEKSRVKKLLHSGTCDYLGLLQTIIKCVLIRICNILSGKGQIHRGLHSLVVGADSLQEGTCKHSMH